MSVQFILGRSGTGKTAYCIRAIVEALLEPSERSLLFLVPEQATYQAERAILSDKRLAGYHRLHILSFDRLQFMLLGKNTVRPLVSRLPIGAARSMQIRRGRPKCCRCSNGMQTDTREPSLKRRGYR